MVAEDRPSPLWRATLCDATGSPERIYNSTMAQRTDNALLLNSIEKLPVELKPEYSIAAYRMLISFPMGDQ
jgi:hypothetical protein